MPYLTDLINEQKNNKDESNESKNQYMGVNFISSDDTGEIRTFFVRSDNEEIRSGNQTNDIINGFLNLF